MVHNLEHRHNLLVRFKSLAQSGIQTQDLQNSSSMLGHSNVHHQIDIFLIRRCPQVCHHSCHSWWSTRLIEMASAAKMPKIVFLRHRRKKTNRKIGKAENGIKIETWSSKTEKKFLLFYFWRNFEAKKSFLGVSRLLRRWKRWKRDLPGVRCELDFRLLMSSCPF